MMVKKHPQEKEREDFESQHRQPPRPHLVLDGGRIVQQGSHVELSQTAGLYQHLLGALVERLRAWGSLGKRWG